MYTKQNDTTQVKRKCGRPPKQNQKNKFKLEYYNSWNYLHHMTPQGRKHIPRQSDIDKIVKSIET